MMLIGSRALAFWNKDFKARPDSDYDVISDIPLPKGDCRVEHHGLDILNNNEIYENYGSGRYVEVNGVSVEVCNMDGLRIIKRSHLHRDWFFDKHITHYHKYMNDGFMVPGMHDYDVMRTRFEMTLKAYPQGKPTLNKTNEEFFDDAVVKKYDHDWIHELAAYTDAPMYTKMKRDKTKAWCEKDMWDEFTHEQKLMCTAEETYVIACERFQIPTDWDGRYRRSYMDALKKVCTTLTSGWFRDFALDNYPSLIDMFDREKFEDIKMKIRESEK